MGVVIATVDDVTFFDHDRERENLRETLMTALIHSDPRTVDRRLSQYFNSTRDQWIDIVKAAVERRHPEAARDLPEARRGRGGDFRLSHYLLPRSIDWAISAHNSAQDSGVSSELATFHKVSGRPVALSRRRASMTCG